MSKNEPIIKTHGNEQAQLCLFYNILSQKILYSNQPAEEFFGVAFNPDNDPPFCQLLEENNMVSLWHSCLHLEQNESVSFTIASKEKPQQLFFFTVTSPSSLLKDSNVLIVMVSKSIVSPVADYKNYNEFIELASHDLDSPLRKLILLAERVIAKLDDSIDPESKKYLQRMQSSLSDIRVMVDDLSALAKINTAPLSLSKCNIEDIINEALNELLQHTEIKPVVLTESLPVLEADAIQYKKLFSNLLQNAIKFRRKDTIPEIKIFSEILQDALKKYYQLPVNKTYYKIIVEDNGIGFSQENAEKIFIPFVRLNGKSEYPGSGIGLALCKKIVENHGGMIYAHSDERSGASFTLILPQSPQH